jgi:hypothetical protein
MRKRRPKASPKPSSAAALAHNLAATRGGSGAGRRKAHRDGSTLDASLGHVFEASIPQLSRADLQAVWDYAARSAAEEVVLAAD